MTELVQRTYDISTKAGASSRSVRVRASSAAIDSYDEIVEQDWQLERYLRNPVVLYGHNKSGFLGAGGAPEDSLPIGFASDVKVVGGCLESTLNFVDEKANPMGERVLQGFLQGSIRAVSVGFKPGTAKSEMLGGRSVYRLSENELFEISVVPMGANPEAVALSAKVAAAQRVPYLKAVTEPAPVVERFLKICELDKIALLAKLQSTSMCNDPAFNGVLVGYKSFADDQGNAYALRGSRAARELHAELLARQKTEREHGNRARVASLDARRRSSILDNAKRSAPKGAA